MDLETIEVDSVVTIHYKLTLDGGEVVDSSEGATPLDYLHGHGNIVPGLEEDLTGRKVGESISVQVPPDRGYGLPDPAAVQKVPRSTFPTELALKPGVILQAEDGDGRPVHLRVVEVGEQEVTVDLNHPLAGQTLNFEVEVVAVRTATQEELAHGHVHGPGGHSH